MEYEFYDNLKANKLKEMLAQKVSQGWAVKAMGANAFQYWVLLERLEMKAAS
jgi:hypothetical protein